MPATRVQDDLIRLQLGPEESALANDAPTGEPETWSPGVPAFSPLLARTPEPPDFSGELSDEFAEAGFEIETFLTAERNKELLRFSTAGSVDDGKSTLIGRLLYDTRSVYEDQVRSIEGKGTTAVGVLDLALLTDGLRAEREQGITIDVAYRYFSTARRKFIIADTPGHVQYTRNMATGASTADVAIVLVDARKGVLPQSRRHAYITALLGVRHVIVAINKMDLIGFDQATFDSISESFTEFFRAIDFGDDVGTRNTELFFVPVSALAGDNVAHPSRNTPWYAGSTLLELLETIPVSIAERQAPFRLAVQRVVRPNLDFRGFAGQIASGTVRPGDAISVLPSGRSSRIASIVTFAGNLSEAAAPLSVTLTLEDEIDISRGDLLTSIEEPATVTNSFTASLVWMDTEPLELDRRYLLKHTSRTVQARVQAVSHALGIELDNTTPDQHTLALNGIGLVNIITTVPVTADTYAANRTTGSFVLINPETNTTAAAGMIRSLTGERQITHQALGPVSIDERLHRWGHPGAVIRVSAPADLVDAMERALFDRGVIVLRSDPQHASSLSMQGAVALVAEPQAPDSFSIILGGLERSGSSSELSAVSAAESVLDLFRQYEAAQKGLNA